MLRYGGETLPCCGGEEWSQSLNWSCADGARLFRVPVTNVHSGGAFSLEFLISTGCAKCSIDLVSVVCLNLLPCTICGSLLAGEA